MAFPKVAVVTAASAGVGRATGRLFAKKGANVAFIARGIDGLEAARREIESLKRHALVRLPRKPQPVQPIFQSQLAAKAIVYAATENSG